MTSSVKQSPKPIAFFAHADLPTITAQQHNIACVPVRVKGKRGANFTKHIPKVYDNLDLKKAKVQLAEILAPFKPPAPLDGALSLRIYWAWPWRKAEPKKNRMHGTLICYTKPDCDNLIKSLQDIMEKQGFWVNDSRIGHLEVMKSWCDVPGLGIEIAPIDTPPPSFARLQHLQEFGI